MRTASLLCALVALFASCSGSSGGLAPPPAPATFAGEWSGVFQSSRGLTGVLGCTLKEPGGNAVSTTNLEVVGGQCNVSTNANGTYNGPDLTLTATMTAGGSLTFDASLNGDTLQGTYRISGGRCGGDTGAVHLTRTQ